MSTSGGAARFVVATTAVLLIAAVLLVAYVLTDALAQAQRPLAAIEARYARLAGLKEVRAQIESEVAEVAQTLSRHAYPAASGTDRIGTDLQQRVRRIAESAGMGVTGSQILPVRTLTGFSNIPVAVTVEGSLDGLRTMLLGLRQETPSILVDSIVIQNRAHRRARTAPMEERLTAQMNLSVVHLQR